MENNQQNSNSATNSNDHAAFIVVVLLVNFFLVTPVSLFLFPNRLDFMASIVAFLSFVACIGPILIFASKFKIVGALLLFSPAVFILLYIIIAIIAQLPLHGAIL